MSWSWPPRLVTLGPGAELEINWQDFWAPFPASGRGNPLEPSEDNFFCHETVNGIAYTNECFHPEDRSGRLEFPIAEALDMIPDIHDWYSIHLSCSFPSMPAAHLSCSGTELEPGGQCADQRLAVTAEIVGGTLIGTGFGNPVEQQDGHGVVSETLLLPVEPYTNFNLLLNPAPTYPVPDVDGNEAGSVLFSRAEADAIAHDIELTWGIGPDSRTFWGHWDPANVPHSPFIHTSVSIAVHEDIVIEGPTPGYVTARPGIGGRVRRRTGVPRP